ncbi:hypothetical protein EBU95_02280 [bacterium]|nr:hypothetical protein [bacterium]
MTDTFSFDYEFFFKGAYDAEIFNKNPFNTSGDFEQQIIQVVETMQKVLALHTGVNRFSSFVDFEGKRYRVTLSTL